MLSKLASIAQNSDIKKITGLDENSLKMLLFLIYDPNQEYSYGELGRRMKDFGFDLTDSQLSDSLKKLREKNLILHEREGELRRNKPSSIRIIIEDIQHKLELQKQIDKGIEEIEAVVTDSKEMSEAEIFEELKRYKILQASTSLYLKLLRINDTLNEDAFIVGSLWTGLFYEYIVDLYLEEIEKRGRKSITEILHLYYQT